MNPFPLRPCAALLPLLLVGRGPAQDEEPGKVPAADLARYENWLEAWSRGDILLVKQGRLDRRADRTFRKLFDKVAAGADLVAARRLWQAAVMQLSSDIDKMGRLAASPGRVTGYAKKLIARIPDAAVDPWLLETAMRRGGAAGNRYRLAALEIMGLRERPETGKLLFEQLDKFPVPERIEAVLALERTGSLEMLPALLQRLKARDPNLRIALVQTITGILAPYSDQMRERNLEPDAAGARIAPIVIEAFRQQLLKEKVWQVRAAICDGFVQMRHKGAIPVLIDGLARELRLGRWSNLMVAIRFHEGLEQLTGRSLPENAPHLWKDFWRKEAAGFKFVTHEQRERKEIPGSGRYAHYFNVDIKSRQILFVIDFSGSMAEKVQLTGGRYGKSSRHVKYQLVKEELEKVIRALPPDTYCNVVFFSDEVGVWRRTKEGRPARVRMNDGNKSDLLEYIWETSPGGSTNLYGAIKLALAMGDRGVYDKHYKLAFDSIFILSDGAPSSGEITDTRQIKERVRKANKLRRVKIHTIVFGDATNNIDFMRELAEENGGNFVHIQ